MRNVLVALVLVACGPNKARKPRHGECSDSIAARSRGDYDKVPERSSEAAELWNRYRDSCAIGCSGDDSPPCLELHWLTARYQPILAAESLIEMCKQGDTDACDWIATHEQDVRNATAYDPNWRDWYVDPDTGGSSGGGTGGAAAGALSEYISYLDNRASTQGFSLNTSVSVESDGFAAAYSLSTSPGMSTLVYVVSDEVTFDAEVVAEQDGERVGLDQTANAPAGVYGMEIIISGAGYDAGAAIQITSLSGAGTLRLIQYYGPL